MAEEKWRGKQGTPRYYFRCLRFWLEPAECNEPLEIWLRSTSSTETRLRVRSCSLASAPIRGAVICWASSSVPPSGDTSRKKPVADIEGQSSRHAAPIRSIPFFIAADAGGGSYRVSWLFSDTHTPPPLRALNTVVQRTPPQQVLGGTITPTIQQTMNSVLLPTIRVWRNKDGGSGCDPSALMELWAPSRVWRNLPR